MNSVINFIYEHKINTPSDINQHLSVLYEYALKVNHITEFGTRFGCSTYAFLNANPKKMISYDICKTKDMDSIIALAKEANINYTFIEEDTLKIEIEDTNLLFIDTFHSYDQLYRELSTHHSKVKNYIIMHDTETFGQQDMPYDGPISPHLNRNIHKQGLKEAIKDFLLENNQWRIQKVYRNNNGLTILHKE